MISSRDFDDILNTEKKPRRLLTSVQKRFPNHVEVDWIHVTHKYTIAFELVCHCLELCGLRKETVRIEKVNK